MRSQRSPLVRAAQSKRIKEGNCGKQVDHSDDDYNLSKTEHPAREHSKSGTHCHLRQGTESKSYKQIVALVLVRLDHVVSRIVNANQRIM